MHWADELIERYQNEITGLEETIQQCEYHIKDLVLTISKLKQKKLEEDIKDHVKIPDDLPKGTLIKVKSDTADVWYLRKYNCKTERGTVMCESAKSDCTVADQALFAPFEDYTQWEWAECINEDDFNELVLIPRNLNWQFRHMHTMDQLKELEVLQGLK